MKIVYLSLGSNLGDREQMLQRAIDLLHAPDLRILRVSSVHETEPIGFKQQRDFLNVVVEAETGLFPLQLLSRIQKIERQLGRQRLLSNGPRTIDIDILFFGGFVIQSIRLVVPHPRLHERRFVLAPLCELAPDLRHPVLRLSMKDLLAAVPAQRVRRVANSSLTVSAP